MKLLNSFSINMLPDGGMLKIEKSDISVIIHTNVRNPKGFRAVRGEAASITHHIADIECCIGHQDLCNIIADKLSAITEKEVTLTANRASVTLTFGETAIVAQYCGPRLAEGTHLLPEGAKIEFYSLTVVPDQSEKETDKLKHFSRLKRAWEDDFQVGQHEAHPGFLKMAFSIFGEPIMED